MESVIYRVQSCSLRVESGIRVELVNNMVESVVIRVELGTLMVRSVIIRVESVNNRVESGIARVDSVILG